MDPARFARWAIEHRPRLVAMLGDNSPVIGAIDDMAEYGRRLGPISAETGSQTARMLWFNQLFGAIKGGELSAPGMIKTLASLSTSRGIAETLTNPVRRDIFLGLVNPPRNLTINAVKDSLARLTALDARDSSMAGEVVEPQQDPQRDRRQEKERDFMARERIGRMVQ